MIRMPYSTRSLLNQMHCQHLFIYGTYELETTERPPSTDLTKNYITDDLRHLNLGLDSVHQKVQDRSRGERSWKQLCPHRPSIGAPPDDDDDDDDDDDEPTLHLLNNMRIRCCFL